MSSEGYLIVALDRPVYLALAANAVLSIKRLCKRPVAVVVNDGSGMSTAYAPLFDHIVRADALGLAGATAKLALHTLSPFDKTLYVDADCLLFRQPDALWEWYRGRPMGLVGQKITDGRYFTAFLRGKKHEVPVGEVIKMLEIPYMVATNSGQIYFEKGEKSDGMFEAARGYYEGPYRDKISYAYKFAGEYAGEPYLSAAMGKMELEPITDEDPLHSAQVTTPNTFAHSFNLVKGECYMAKGRSISEIKIRSGYFCHFCGLWPRNHYLSLANQLRSMVNITLPPFKLTV